MLRWDNANLSFNNKKIFNNLNFTVERDTKILITNRSGSGKSTLIKTALGLTELDSGAVFINNQPLNPHNIEDIRNTVFYLDQDVTLPELNVNELIEKIFQYKGNRHLVLDNNELMDLLKDFKLEAETLRKNIKELSGGERQRIGLILGILLKRAVWVLDEPTSALDPELKELVVRKVINTKCTAIIVSHDNCWKENNLIISKEVEFL